ncbi:MAG: hypothetical protein JWO38_6222 [Gemmataceae bacterium]|nr:hypothetical protein [Gemmataceae bacterium]
MSRLTNKPTSILNLTWVTVPPIKELSKAEAQLAVKQLQTNLAGWDPVAVPLNPAEDDVDKRDWKLPKRTQQERWNTRLLSTNKMVQAEFSGVYFVAYYIDGQPIGVLAMSNYHPLPYINDLVTHPGSEAAGGILIECAVQKSVDWGKDGLLELCALDEDAGEAYKALGFISRSPPESKDEMTLEPSKNEQIWCNLSGKWQIKKYIGTQFIG